MTDAVIFFHNQLGVKSNIEDANNRRKFQEN